MLDCKQFICHQKFQDLSLFDEKAKMQPQQGLAGAARRSNFTICSFYKTFLSSVLWFFLFPDLASLTLPFPPRLRDQQQLADSKLYLQELTVQLFTSQQKDISESVPFLAVRVKNDAVLVCGLNGCNAQPTTLAHTHTPR